MQRVLPHLMRQGSVKTAGLFTLLVLAQIGFLHALTGVAHGDTTSFFVALALGGPILALVLVLFPGQVLFAAPLLILVPVQFVFLNAFEWVFVIALLVYTVRHLASHSLDIRFRTIDVVFL